MDGQPIRTAIDEAGDHVLNAGQAHAGPVRIPPDATSVTGKWSPARQEAGTTDHEITGVVLRLNRPINCGAGTAPV